MNRLTHVFVGGMTGSGKSYLQAVIAASAATSCHTFIVDSNRFFRGIPRMHESHAFVRLADMRLNLWDGPDGVSPHLVDQHVNHEIARSYGLQFAEYEIAECVRSIREACGVANLEGVIQRLETKLYGKFSKRTQYRDIALLILKNLLFATGELFRCARGMNLRDLIAGNVVLEVDGLAEHHAFIVRYIFEYLHLLAQSGRPLDKPLLFFLDEGQVIATQRDFAVKMLQLRHHGIHLLANFQNASLAPIELLGNCDALISFQCVDERDRATFARAANLTSDMMAHLPLLKQGECVCSFPRLGWSPLLCSVPRLDFRLIDNEYIARRSVQFLERFPWVASQASANDGVADSGSSGLSGAGGVDEKTEAFLRDVLNQSHEFSSLMRRFERAGIRSASKQGSILRTLTGEGLVRIWELPVGRGRPLKLVEPTEKAFERYGVTWKVGRGSLPARAATEFLYQKIRRWEGWHCQKEGMLDSGDGEQKRVDLLCRDPENRVVAIEVAGSVGHEVHNALHCLKSVEVRKHVVVCVNKRVCDAVKKRFAGVTELVGNERVEVITLATALRDGWEP